MNEKLKRKMIIFIPIIVIIIFILGRQIYGILSPIKVYRNKHVVSIGDGIGKVESLLGKPKRTDNTLYGETWDIYYNDDFSEYVQIESKAKIITGIQTTSEKWIFPGGLKVGSKLKEDRKKLYNNFKKRGSNLTILLEDDRETISFIGVKKEKKGLLKTKNEINEETLKVQEQQIIDFLNSKQAKLGKSLFKRHEVLDEIAENNSIYLSKSDGFKLNADAKTNTFKTKTEGLNMGKGLSQEYKTLDKPYVIVNQLYNYLNSKKIIRVRDYSYVGVSVITDEKKNKVWTTCQLAEKLE